MKIQLFLLSLSFFFCSSITALGNKVLIITEYSQLKDFVGQIVEIRGKVTDTKIPQIIGVEIRSINPDLRKQKAKAIGLLEELNISNDDAKEMDVMGIAHRGPGVFYRLLEEEGGEVVQAEIFVERAEPVAGGDATR